MTNLPPANNGGTVFGERQPIAGAHFYAFIVAAAWRPLHLFAGCYRQCFRYPTASDGTNYFVTTDMNGMFEIAADTTCSSGFPVYLYSSGGDAGSGVNSAAGLMATVGVCACDGLLQDLTGPHVSMNEVPPSPRPTLLPVMLSTLPILAATFAACWIRRPTMPRNSTPLTSRCPQARSTTPGGNGAVPQSEINTLGNILAACVNTAGPSSPACSDLFADIESSGTSGSVASDTAAAAIYIAHNPWANVSV